MIDNVGAILMSIISVGLLLLVIGRIIYGLIKSRKNHEYKDTYISDFMKIDDPTTGLPKSMVDKTQADDYLREARNMESRKAINRDIDDF